MAKRRDESEVKPLQQPETDESQPAGDDGERLRQNSGPICPGCNVPMLANRSEPYFTRYYCPSKCGYSQKVPKPSLRNLANRGRSLREPDDHSAR